MAYTAAVLTISDKGFRGERTDTSGPALRAMLEDTGWEVVHSAVLPDEREQIQAALIDCADRLRVNLVLTTTYVCKPFRLFTLEYWFSLHFEYTFYPCML